MRKRLKDAEERNGELEKEKEDLIVEGAVASKKRYRASKVDPLSDAYDDADGLGKKAEEIGMRMRRMLKKMSEGGLDDDIDEEEADEDLQASLDREAEMERKEKEKQEDQDRLDEKSFSERYGTNVDSGPSTPTLEILLDSVADKNVTDGSRNHNRDSYLSAASTNTTTSDETKRNSFRSSLSSLTGSAAPIQQPSAQESALIAALLMQIAELQNSQMGFDYERAELLGKLETAQEEVEDLRREIDEMDEEYGYDDDDDEDQMMNSDDEMKLGWQARKGLIGWRPEEPRKAGGNRALIEIKCAPCLS